MQLDLNLRWAKLQFNSNVRLRLYRKIAKMLANGLPLLKILEELQDRASSNGKKPLRRFSSSSPMTSSINRMGAEP